MIRAGTEDDRARVDTTLPSGRHGLRDPKHWAALTIPLADEGMPGASRVAVRLQAGGFLFDGYRPSSHTVIQRVAPFHVLAAGLAACTKYETSSRNDTDVASNFTAPVPGVPPDKKRVSNRPAPSVR